MIDRPSSWRSADELDRWALHDLLWLEGLFLSHESNPAFTKADLNELQSAIQRRLGNAMKGTRHG